MKKAIGFVWYRREDYPRVLEVMEDAHLLPSTFDDWLQRAENGIDKFKGQGVITIKAHLDPDAFVSWCRTLGLNVNATARTRFANEAAARKLLDFKEH